MDPLFQGVRHEIIFKKMLKSVNCNAEEYMKDSKDSLPLGNLYTNIILKQC